MNKKHTISDPLKLTFTGFGYKVNKPDVEDGEFVNKEIAVQLAEALEDILIEYKYACKLFAEANGRTWSENNVSIKAKQAIQKATE